jgi:hypothetical protein
VRSLFIKAMLNKFKFKLKKLILQLANQCSDILKILLHLCFGKYLNMSCVWNGLIKGLKLVNTEPIELLEKLQKENVKTSNMLWNNEKLSDQYLNDNYNAIKELSYDKHIKDGYDCASCDPLLLLVGQIFKVSIHHEHVGNKFIYTNKKSNKILLFSSNNKHFTFLKKATKQHERTVKQELYINARKKNKKNSEKSEKHNKDIINPISEDE